MFHFTILKSLVVLCWLRKQFLGQERVSIGCSSKKFALALFGANLSCAPAYPFQPFSQRVAECEISAPLKSGQLAKKYAVLHV